MKIILTTALLLLSTIAYSAEPTIAVSVFKPNPYNSWDGDSSKYGFIASYETEDTHPITVTYQFTPSYSTVDSHTSIGVGKQGRHYINGDVYVYGEVGGLVNSRKTEASSTYFNFALGAGVAYKDFRIGLKHVSNAYTGDINNGEDMLYVSYVF